MKLKSLWRKRKDVMEFNEKEKTSAVKQQALQALHDENVRLGLYDGVYAIDVLEQENRLLRARNERLEKELTKTINEEYRMMKTQPEQEPVTEGWCDGCNPDNCQGCGPAAKPKHEPIFWYRPVGEDGGYEGPIHNGAIEKVRKLSGVWKPLYTTPPPHSASR